MARSSKLPMLAPVALATAAGAAIVALAALLRRQAPDASALVAFTAIGARGLLAFTAVRSGAAIDKLHLAGGLGSRQPPNPFAIDVVAIGKVDDEVVDAG